MPTTYTDNLQLKNSALGSTDWKNEEDDNRRVLDVVLAGVLSKNKIISGCEVTDSGGLTIDVSEGSIRFDNNTVPVSSIFDVSLYAGVSEEVWQQNWVYVNAAGAVLTSPIAPTGDIAPLAVVDCSDTDVLRIADIRSLSANAELTKESVGLGNVENVDQTNADNINKGTLSEARVAAAIARRLVPPPGVLVTGNTIGLNCTPNAASPADSIDVSAGTCMDSTNSIRLTLTSNTTAVLSGATINTTYHLFLTDAGTVEFDTDPGGANVLAGAFTSLRWIWLVHINSGGNISAWEGAGDSLICAKKSDWVVTTSLLTTYTAVDMSGFFPNERVETVMLGGHGNNTQILLSYDGSSVAAGFNGAAAGSDDASQYAWGDNYGNLSLPPIGLQAKILSASTHALALHKINFKR